MFVYTVYPNKLMQSYKLYQQYSHCRRAWLSDSKCFILLPVINSSLFMGLRHSFAFSADKTGTRTYL